MTIKQIALAALLPLAACKPAAEPAPNNEAMTANAEAPAPAPMPEPAAPADNAAAMPADEGNAATPAAAPKPTNIPEQFRGRWGLTANDCKPEFASAAKGLLTIDDNRLKFYESRGTLDRIDAWTPTNRFTANYGFSGEGQNWERVITFERLPGKLRRIEQGGDEGPVDLTYSACPA